MAPETPWGPARRYTPAGSAPEKQSLVLDDHVGTIKQFDPLLIEMHDHFFTDITGRCCIVAGLHLNKAVNINFALSRLEVFKGLGYQGAKGGLFKL